MAVEMVDRLGELGIGRSVSRGFKLEGGRV